MKSSGLKQLPRARGIQELRRLNRDNLEKTEGNAKIRLEDGTVRLAEIHWYEGHGKGRKEIKIKKYLE